MIKIKYFLITIFFFCAVANGQSWNLVWSDEFNSNSINTSNWTFEYGNSGWGNNELEYYTGRADNAKVTNGNLMIIAKKESYGGSNYTSARMKTQGLQSFKYGKIEASIKLPSGKGLWPAFWMLGDNISFVGWPKCGEIDIMEHINTRTSVNGTAHWDNNGHTSSGGIYPAIDVTQYHLYSVEWSDQFINFFVDGNKYWTVSIANNVNSTDEFHQPFFIILNMAVGGDWPGSPDNSTLWPDTMFVDYVRVYQQGSTDVNQTDSKTPTSFSLSQNYPNPFNPITTIKFSVPSVGAEHVQPLHVLLKVFDALGREISTLVNEEKQPGDYEAKFDGANLPSGVYFYTMSANSASTSSASAFMFAKKMILIK